MVHASIIYTFVVAMRVLNFDSPFMSELICNLFQGIGSFVRYLVTLNIT